MKTKFYKVSTATSSREVNARNKKEAVKMFKEQVKGYVSKTDKINVS